MNKYCKSKKILFVNNSLSNGGAERVMTILANEFCRRGYLTDMLILNSKAQETYVLDGRINRIYFDSNGARGARFVIKWLNLIRQQQKQKNYAAIISFMMVNNVLTLLAGIGLGQKIIVSERCDPRVLKDNGIVFRIGEQIIYPFAHRIVFQTEDVRELYKKSIKRRSVVIPNPVNPDMPLQCRFEDREKKVVSVGRLSVQKNYPMLLKAFARFSQHCPEYVLEIYGKGELEEELKLLVGRLGIAEKTMFQGFVENVDDCIRKARMFVMSSDFEGISNTMIEAMAMGIPTICTDCPVGGAKMMIESEKNGILVPVGNVNALYEAMVRLAEDGLFAEKIGNAALKVKEKFSISKIADLWEDAIDGSDWRKG